MTDKFMSTTLLMEGDLLTTMRTDAATFVRKKAVDELEAELFLEILGIDEATIAGLREGVDHEERTRAIRRAAAHNRLKTTRRAR